jgi:hypothetical protein
MALECRMDRVRQDFGHRQCRNRSTVNVSNFDAAFIEGNAVIDKLLH